jgi:hypothetical protein
MSMSISNDTIGNPTQGFLLEAQCLSQLHQRVATLIV